MCWCLLCVCCHCIVLCSVTVCHCLYLCRHFKGSQHLRLWSWAAQEKYCLTLRVKELRCIKMLMAAFPGHGTLWHHYENLIISQLFFLDEEAVRLLSLAVFIWSARICYQILEPCRKFSLLQVRVIFLLMSELPFSPFFKASVSRKLLVSSCFLMLFSASWCFNHFSSFPNLQLLYDISTNSVGNLNNPVHNAVLQHKPDHHSSVLGCDAGSSAKCFPVFWRAVMPSLSRVRREESLAQWHSVASVKTWIQSSTAVETSDLTKLFSLLQAFLPDSSTHILCWLRDSSEVSCHVPAFMILPEFLNKYMVWTVGQPLSYDHSSW